MILMTMVTIISMSNQKLLKDIEGSPDLMSSNLRLLNSDNKRLYKRKIRLNLK